VDPFIPNDTLMCQDQGRVHVITGPNASGKSCYTKQVRQGSAAALWPGPPWRCCVLRPTHNLTRASEPAALPLPRRWR
jgi:hypothetical protein